jgi:hypothetical protein
MLFFLACAWVTNAEKEAMLGTLDEDGDNARADVDCNDQDPTIRPGVEEIWYDGVDQDCDGANDYDQDGDGYVPDEYADKAGDLLTGDCCDFCAPINPGQADPPYDGLDQNCDGKDDFDADGDGYASLADRSFITSISGTDCDPSRAGQPVGDFCSVAVQDVPVGDDCYDSDQDLLEGFVDEAGVGAAGVNPGANDTPYDGTNADCGTCDDFDADCDGVIAESAGGDDCNDADAAILPGGIEILCDGIDQDCDGEDGRDQDGDGFPGCDDGSGEVVDCDDSDSSIYPGAAESLSDVVDGDCDGNANTVNMLGLTERGWTFENPISVGYAGLGNELNLAIVADSLHAETPDGGSLDAYDGSTGVTFQEDDASIGYTTLSVARWSSGSANTGRYVLPGGVVRVVDDVIYELSATNLVQTGEDFPRLALYRTGETVALLSFTDPLAPYEDLALGVEDSGLVHAFGCGSGSDSLVYFRVDSVSTASDIVEGYPASACAADATPTVLLHDSGIIQEYSISWATNTLTLTPTTFTPSILSHDLEVTDGSQGRVVAIANDNGNIKLYNADTTTDDVRDSTDALTVELKEDLDGTRVIAFVNQDGEAWLAYDTGFGFNAISLTLPSGLTPIDVTIWPGESGIHIAVSGSYGDGSGEVAIGLVRL